jgi:glucan phosphorylase
VLAVPLTAALPPPPLCPALPCLAVAELMRQLMDHERLGWTMAWDLVCRTCNFTNHTGERVPLPSLSLPLFLPPFLHL